jgi:hypothetical protein
MLAGEFSHCGTGVRHGYSDAGAKQVRPRGDLLRVALCQKQNRTRAGNRNGFSEKPEFASLSDVAVVCWDEEVRRLARRGESYFREYIFRRAEPQFDALPGILFVICGDGLQRQPACGCRVHNQRSAKWPGSGLMFAPPQPRDQPGE